MLYVQVQYLPSTWTVISGVINAIAVALMTAGCFGVIFEYFSKLSLINEAVERTVGPTKAVNLGVGDMVKQASEINYDDDILTSSDLIVASRFSANFLNRHKDRIFERLNSGKSVKFIRMTASSASRLPGYSENRIEQAQEFFRKLSVTDARKQKQCFLFETEYVLSYNFVVCDRGIWVKQYWNAARSDTPPAYFVKRGTPLYLLFLTDVENLLAEAKALTL